MKIYKLHTHYTLKSNKNLFVMASKPSFVSGVKEVCLSFLIDKSMWVHCVRNNQLSVPKKRCTSELEQQQRNTTAKERQGPLLGSLR